MKFPHTHFRRGTMVWLRLKDRSEHVGRFIERRERFVVLDCGRFRTRDLSAMTYWKRAASVMDSTSAF